MLRTVPLQTKSDFSKTGPTACVPATGPTSAGAAAGSIKEASMQPSHLIGVTSRVKRYSNAVHDPDSAEAYHSALRCQLPGSSIPPTTFAKRDLSLQSLEGFAAPCLAEQSG